MSRGNQAVVIDRDGRQGTIEGGPEGIDRRSQLRVQMEDGREVLVPAALLEQRDDGSYYLPASLGQPETAGYGQDGTDIVVPVIAEELDVKKRRVRNGGVRVTKRVRHVKRVVDDIGFSEEVEVERVPMNQEVDSPPPVRYEGDTMVIPLLKEVLVVEKRLVVKEELRITKRRQKAGTPEEVTLRSEEAIVERLSGSNAEGEPEIGENETI